MFANSGRFFRFISNKDWKADLVVSRVLVPLGVLTLYFISFSRLLPVGVNKVFVTRSGTYVLLITIFLYLVFFAFIKLGRVKPPFRKTSRGSLSARDLTLLLLPLAPVVQYILNNQDILSPFDSFYVLFVFALFVALFVLLIPILLTIVGSTRTAMFLGLAFAFSITNMAALSRQFAWFEEGDLKIQLAVFSGVLLVSWFLFHLNYQKLLYLLIAAFFLTNSVSQLLARDDGSFTTDLDGTDNKLVTLIGSKEPAVTPSVYLLVYDAYVANETMLAYGIDNRSQEQYLEKLDFRIYPRTYSVGGTSVSTMSRVLNASVDYYGNPRKGVSGDGTVQNLLKGFGYKTYGVFASDHFGRGIVPSYDYSFPSYSSSANTLLKAILLGEFRFTIAFDNVSREQFIVEKINLFSEESEDPKFIYMHSNFPTHSQNSGACLPNEVEFFNERLLRANLEMRQDVETIIENDPEAIVIVAGDHGPYLTKNCSSTGDSYDISEISRLDLQDRFGTFLAIRWPTEDFEKFDDITVLQDLFSAIFAYLFQDQRLLESKIEPATLEEETVSGAAVVDGMIEGGVHSGESLFTGGK